MKTPYDAALRYRRYEVDRLRIEAAALSTRIASFDGALGALDAAVAEEQARGAAFEGFADYAARMRTERAGLEAQRLAAQRALDAIEAAVVAAWRELKPLEIVAGTYLADRHLRQAHNDRGQALVKAQ